MDHLHGRAGPVVVAERAIAVRVRLVSREDGSDDVGEIGDHFTCESDIVRTPVRDLRREELGRVDVFVEIIPEEAVSLGQCARNSSHKSTEARVRGTRIRLFGGQFGAARPLGQRPSYVEPMDDREPTIRSRELGEALRVAMDGAGFNAKQLADKLDWSPSRLSRLLSGKRGGTEMDVVSFLAVCGASAEERERLLGLCRQAGTPGWLQQHGDRLPKQLRTLVDHEDKAVRIGDYQPVIVPGLLQTGDYARAVMQETGNAPEHEIEDRVAARLARQALFSRRPAVEFTFFVHEFVLRLPVGGALVMSGQLHHLLRMSVRPSIRLRVVPASVGGHAGVAGQFKLMEFTSFRPIVYLDSETSSLFLEEPTEIAAYRRVLDGLADKALGEGQSKQLIADLAIELYPCEEDDDE